jgi:hypothetical protein
MSVSIAVLGAAGCILVAAAAYAFSRPWRDTPLDKGVLRTSWIPIDEVLAVIRDRNWVWFRNNRCKYISVRIDTRSRFHMCVIFDRYGAPITLDDLKLQHNGKQP